jgi:hypothetical protein
MDFETPERVKERMRAALDAGNSITLRPHEIRLLLDGPTCQVGWINCDGKDTYHNEKAVGTAQITSSYGNEPITFAVCEAHAGQLERGRAHFNPDCRHFTDFNGWTYRVFDKEER